MAFFARRDHAGHKSLDAVDDTHDVDAMNPAPVVGCRLPYIGGRGRNTRVIEEKVTGPVSLKDPIGQGIDRGTVRDVSYASLNIAPGSRQL